MSKLLRDEETEKQKRWSLELLNEAERFSK